MPSDTHILYTRLEELTGEERQIDLIVYSRYLARRATTKDTRATAFSVYARPDENGASELIANQLAAFIASGTYVMRIPPVAVPATDDIDEFMTKTKKSDAVDALISELMEKSAYSPADSLK